MTKVCNWVIELKVAPIEEKLVGRDSGVQKNRRIWIIFVYIEYQIVRSGKKWTSIKRKTKSRGWGCKQSDVIRITNSTSSNNQYTASLAQAKVVNVNSEQNRWEHTALVDAIRDKKLSDLLDFHETYILWSGYLFKRVLVIVGDRLRWRSLLKRM